MDESQKNAENAMGLIAHLSEQMAILSTFAVAVARSHPNPKDLLLAFEKTIAEDEDGETLVAELTPDNKRAREDRDTQRDMLLHVIRSRVSS